MRLSIYLLFPMLGLTFCVFGVMVVFVGSVCLVFELICLRLEPVVCEMLQQTHEQHCAVICSELDPHLLCCPCAFVCAFCARAAFLGALLCCLVSLDPEM